MWLIVALIGYALSAVVNIFDKYVLEKTIGRPVVFVFFSTIFALLFFIAVPWVGGLSSNFDYLVALFCGAFFIFGLWSIYSGIQKSEISHIGPLIGAVVPIFTFIWSKIFFAEQFSKVQIAAIIFLVLGSLVIAFQRGEKELRAGLIWGVLGAFFWSIFAASAKYLYDNNDFTGGFVWSQGAVGLVSAFLLLLPAVRKSLSRSETSSASFIKQGAKKIIFVFFDKLLGLLSLALVQYAVALGSVTIVYAMAGFQYALLVLFVAILSGFKSKFYKEKYVRGELVQEAFAVLLIGLGLALLI